MGNWSGSAIARWTAAAIRAQKSVLPIRISRDAFGPGQPHCDLLLSPDHALLFDGVLIPVRCLVNDVNIVRDTADMVTYYHVELDRHDVIWAAGLAVESFLDTGNRSAFANGGQVVTAHPDFNSRVWEAAGCAPLVIVGQQVEQARAMLRARADVRRPARSAGRRFSGRVRLGRKSRLRQTYPGRCA